MLYGKSASISDTCLLVSFGAPGLGGAVNTGSPVIGSLILRSLRDRFFFGVRTMRSPSMSTFRPSAARKFSFAESPAFLISRRWAFQRSHQVGMQQSMKQVLTRFAPH